MGCSCSIDTADFDGSYCYQLDRKIRTAKKDHPCYECSVTIEKGEKYEYVRGVVEGGFFKNKTCMDCLSVRDNLFCSWRYRSLWDDFFENIENINYDCIADLTPKARGKVCDLIDGYWEKIEQFKKQRSVK